MTSYETLVGYELQNVPKFNSQIKEQVLIQNLWVSVNNSIETDWVEDHAFFLNLDFPIMIF